jgi:hypothetical protein
MFFSIFKPKKRMHRATVCKWASFDRDRVRLLDGGVRFSREAGLLCHRPSLSRT